MERSEPARPCAAVAHPRRRLLLGGVASWALLTAGTMLLLSVITS